MFLVVMICGSHGCGRHCRSPEAIAVHLQLCALNCSEVTSAFGAFFISAVTRMVMVMVMMVL